MKFKPWQVTLAVVAVVAALVGVGSVTGAIDLKSQARLTGAGKVPAAVTGTPTKTITATPTVNPLAPRVQHPPSDERRLRVTKRLVGPFSPKSVVASGTGLVLAANMMYRHTITVFSSKGEVVKTIEDKVNLRDFGQRDYPQGTFRGAPVETAISPDGKYAWVSNYAMYGKGFSAEGKDNCPGRNSLSESFVYRVNLKKRAIDGVIEVGKTPKYLATTPDGKQLLVANWCSYDLSIVDIASMKEVHTVRLGPHPRGIAVTKDSRTAYVAVMGSAGIAKVDLKTRSVSWIRGVGVAPRHVVLSPDEKTLYASINGTGQIVAVSTARKKVIDRVSTGRQPRSLAISPDGTALYVVNYASGNMTKLRARDLKILQTVKTDVHPIGITYDPVTESVWVSCYRGVVYVMADRGTSKRKKATPVPSS
ncbi:MAG: YncE family protein [Actinobacteria bacterium]|nr:YncE family protein [Actinomycetota bacterium]